VEPAETIHELLARAPWCSVDFRGTIHELELPAKPGVQFAWRVAASSDQSGEHALAQATVTEARKRQLKLNRLGLRNILISLTTSSPGASLEYGRLQGFLFRHLRFAPLAILQNLVASVVLHPFPVSTFIARTQAANTKSGLSIKFAYFNARGLHTHPSSYLLLRMHFNRNMRQPCNAV
jgi:hypothetical protein